MRGPSKEHRFDLPLTSIALVINEEGIPIDFMSTPETPPSSKPWPLQLNL